jgi:methyl-accepting chemotaxis protein
MIQRLFAYIKKRIVLKYNTAIIIAVFPVMAAFLLFESYLLRKISQEQFIEDISVQKQIAKESLIIPLWTYDEEGVIKISEAFFSDPEIAGIKVSNDDVMFIDKLKTGDPYHTRYTSTEVIEIIKEDIDVGTITLTFSNFFHQKRFEQLLFTRIIQIIVLTIVLVIILYFILYKILQPISTLSKGTDIIASGDLTYEIPVSTDDELGDLASRFNKMTHALNNANKLLNHDAYVLKEKNAMIQKYTEELEILVDERTSDYLKANEELSIKNQELQETINLLNEAKKPFDSI